MAWLYVLIAVAGCWLLCQSFMRMTQDAKEPPMIPHVIPYIGHLIGLLRQGYKFFGNTSARYKKSVYTLRLPGTKLYVVSCPKVVAAVDRHPSTLSLAPFALDFIKRITLLSEQGVEILEKNFHAEKGAQSFHTDTMRALSMALAPGPASEETTSEMLNGALQFLDSTNASSQCEEVDLFTWTRNLLTQASTDALYGTERNPFHDPALGAALWAVKKDLPLLGLNISPKITCSKAYHGRNALFAGFIKYYQDIGHESGSRVIQTHYEALRRYNLCDEDIAHFDLNICLGLLINTVPATFWALYNVYSRPTLLEEVREAITPHIQLSPNDEEEAGPPRHVNIAEVAASCPLIASIVHETLRVQSVGTSTRKVLKDTLIDDQYLLKQGSMVLMPSAEVHTTSSAWGSSSPPTAFDARRFCANGKFEGKKSSSGYRAFGGGSFLCPGRFFAVNEVIIVLVIMVLKYDLVPVGQQGHPWSRPRSQSDLATALLAPADEMRVKIRERERERKGGDEAGGPGEWRFEWVVEK